MFLRQFEVEEFCECVFHFSFFKMKAISRCANWYFIIKDIYCYWKRKDGGYIISFFAKGNEQCFYGYVEHFEGYLAKTFLYTSNKKPPLFYQERFNSDTPA